MNTERTAAFQRNGQLENLLTSLNDDLWEAEQKLLRVSRPLSKPIIFIVGPQRSGTTLFLQWLVSLKSIAYPTNLLSRFYKAPILGSRIQQLLTDDRYNYRDELSSFCKDVDFESHNGKTKGALSPNEFWYFWRRFLAFDKFDHLTEEQLEETFDKNTFHNELSGIIDTFEQPFALKAMIMNYSLPFLNSLFEKVIFVQLKRDPLTNIASGLAARKKQLGSIDKWYSFKFPEYAKLKNMSPYEQVAGQIYYINKAVDEGMKQIPQHKKLIVQYEEFCRSPAKVYSELVKKLNEHGVDMKPEYDGISQFNVTRGVISDPQIIDAYQRIAKGI